MRGWYDITSLDFGKREQDVDGVLASAEQVNELIDAEVARGIASQNIILAGFSQGGAIALYCGLTSKHKLAGIMALSTYLPIDEHTLARLSDHGRALPVFMAHGQFDDVIELKHAQASLDKLLAEQVAVQWKTYPMAHSVNAEEVVDIANWLKDRMSG